MKTTFNVRQPYADLFMDCARRAPCRSPAFPERFIRKMEHNRGSVASISKRGYDENGLELKNPVIVGLGDSVTAGHFESLDKLTFTDDGKNRYDPVEITDSRESYLEKFRMKLIDRYEETSVSVINCGIAGDNLRMMERRLARDVIRYQPDLVLINGSLNWWEDLGTARDYEGVLDRIVLRVRGETQADVVLLTPNGIVSDPKSCAALRERVEAIRETAVRRHTCLADVYEVWERAAKYGCPWEELLANRKNHPAVLGHEVYAEVLMKLFK